jgi:hypothetical protein
MKHLPHKIKLTITERDRATAKEFINNRGCLIATALRRRGYPIFSVTPYQVTMQTALGSLIDYSASLQPKEIGWDAHEQQWLPSAVGKTHILTRVQ